MFGYCINIEQEQTHRYHSGEQYGDWSEHYSNDFRSIEPVDEYPDVLSFEEIKTGEECYVVWAEWSSGDSFGNATNSCTEGIMVFKSLDQAHELRELLDNGRNDYTQDITLKSGLQLSIQKGWTGYFESLTDIHVTTAIMR